MEPIPKALIAYGLNPIIPTEIYFYDLKSKVCKCKTLPIAKVVKGKAYEPRLAASCAILKNSCLICGGGNITLPAYFDTAVVCSFVPDGEWIFQIKQVEKMLLEKAEHSLCPITDDEILSVGGVYSKGVLNYCEAYSFSKNVWTQYSPLEVPRKQVSLCTFNNEFVYAFGGKNVKELPLLVIEKLKLGSPKNCWRKIVLASEKGFRPLSSSLVCQIDKDVILIAGGTTFILDPKSGPHHAGSLVTLQDIKETVFFNTKTLSFTSGPDLLCPAAFSIGQPYFLNGVACAIDTQLIIHLYDAGKMTWTCLKESQWNSFKFQIKSSSELTGFSSFI